MTIELEQARELLRRAVETQGRDFVYNTNTRNRCHYQAIPVGWRDEFEADGTTAEADDPRTRTGCLIGVALDLAGETRHHGAELSAVGLHERYRDMLSADAAYYLQQAQRVQDQGGTWGQALDKAEDWYQWRTTPSGPPAAPSDRV